MLLQISSALEFQPREHYRIPGAVTVNEVLATEGKIEDTFAQISHGNCIECGARVLFSPECREIT